MPAIRMAELWAPTREVRKADEGRILLTSQLLRSVGVLHRDGDFPDSSAAFGRRILNNPTEMNPCPAGVQDELGNSRIGEASWVAICGGRNLLEIDGSIPPASVRGWGFMLLTLEQMPVKIQTQLDFHGQRETLPRNISTAVDMTHRYPESQFIPPTVSPPGAVAFTHVPCIFGQRSWYRVGRCDLAPNRSRFDLALNHTDPSNCTEILLGTSLPPGRLQVFKCAPDLRSLLRLEERIPSSELVAPDSTRPSLQSTRPLVLVAGCQAFVNGSGSSSSQHVAWFLPSRHSVAGIRSEPLFLESRVLWWSERAV
ncbi:hypothetical protein B0H13DRAFT_1854943 [Mycena leptocephala]|nr:hypothetical protein B0H13DRAFT_1854943 [Mycena leptocephala]